MSVARSLSTFGAMRSLRRISLALLLAASAVTVRAASLDDLPLVVMPPKSDGNAMVLLLSGDGGWQELVETVAGALSAQGYGVVGLNSLKYFWKPRSPEETAGDLERVLDQYGRNWHARQVLLVGYSFGADVLPIVLNRLPQDVRSRVAGLTLIAPSSVANFEVKVSSWLGVGHPGFATVPELERLRGLPIVCLYGETDDDAVCPSLPAGLATVRRMPGGHHFAGDYSAVAGQVLPPSTKK
jgi:type IV secretory pathway VirJ component